MKKYEFTTECSTMENKDCNIKAEYDLRRGC